MWLPYQALTILYFLAQPSKAGAGTMTKLKRADFNGACIDDICLSMVLLVILGDPTQQLPEL